MKFMGASGSDKRKYPRVQARNVSAHLNVANQSSPCTIQNISAGGLFLQTNDVLPPGMQVAVNLARPGWNRALGLTGRVVWALAEKTAAKKGTVPGMRIKFDPLPKLNAQALAELLTELGAPEGPRPVESAETSDRPPVKDPNAITQPISIKEIQARVGASDFPLLREPDARPARRSAPRPVPLAVRMSAPRPAPPSSPKSRAAKVATPVRPDDSTLQVRPSELPPEMRLGSPQLEAPRLIVQVQGLLMQMGDLQSTIEQRDREIEALRFQLTSKQAELERIDRERKAAELAIQRLSMQLASRR